MACRGRILVTGGAGYIGSHTVVQLVDQGFDCVIVDNLSNSSEESIRRVRALCGKPSSIQFHRVDMRNKEELERVFQQYDPFTAVIHFAGLKAVGESVQVPLLYYSHNLGITTNLLELMKSYHCPNIIFSSSATVYGDGTPPFTEQSPVGQSITNPYGRSKYFIEVMLQDYYCAESESCSFQVTVLRYFNPVGAHPSGMIGENPNGVPNNLVPFISQVMVGRRPVLRIFGNDFPTKDGTGVRDYIHVQDLAAGHVAALSKMLVTKNAFSVYNLGTGVGVSVLEMVHALEKASGKTIPYVFEGRRKGDTAENYAVALKAMEELDWKPTKTLDDICKDTWRWQSQNPDGY